MLLAAGISGYEPARQYGPGLRCSVSRASSGPVEMHAWGRRENAPALLERYLAYGAGMLQRTETGPLACMVIDRQNGFIRLIRDRFGFAALFYRTIGGMLYCSDSLKELAALPPRPAIDRTGLARYYLFRFCVPTHTIFDGISQVPGGHSVMFHNGELSIESWDPFPVGTRNSNRTAMLRETIEAAVADALRGARAPAIALSGGLDSAVLHAALPARGASAFNLISRDHLAETEAAEAICQALGTRLNRIAFAAEDFRFLPEYVEALEEPVCVAPLFYLFMLLRGAAGQADVMLLGEGGDELFLGYRHQIELVAQFLEDGLSSGVHRQLRRSRLESDWRKWKEGWGERFAADAFEKAVGCLPSEPAACNLNTFIDALVCQELTCFPYFFAGARLGTFFGIEVRCPLLNRRTVDAAFSIGWNDLLAPEARQGITKLPVRKAFRGRLPDEVLHLPKRGFGEEWTRYLALPAAALELLPLAHEHLREYGLSAEQDNPELLWPNLLLGLWLSGVAKT